MRRGGGEQQCVQLLPNTVYELGVVEKFIGDAVMAVWGTPVAQEDDAEQAVRAALDLVAAVIASGRRSGRRSWRRGRVC